MQEKRTNKGPTRDSPMSLLGPSNVHTWSYKGLVADILRSTISRPKDSVRIKGSLIVDLPKSYQKPLVEKRSWQQRHEKDFAQTQGQGQDRTRATRGHSKDEKD